MTKKDLTLLLFYIAITIVIVAVAWLLGWPIPNYILGIICIFLVLAAYILVWILAGYLYDLFTHRRRR